MLLETVNNLTDHCRICSTFIEVMQFSLMTIFTNDCATICFKILILQFISLCTVQLDICIHSSGSILFVYKLFDISVAFVLHYFSWELALAIYSTTGFLQWDTVTINIIDSDKYVRLFLYWLILWQFFLQYMLINFIIYFQW